MEEEIAEIAKKLVEITSHSGFRYWKEEEFRKLVDFDNISQTEQDRIFNEIICSGLILAMMTLDDISSKNLALERKIVLSRVRDAIPEGYTNTLKSLGVERKFVRIWKKLIDLRKNEYFKDLTLAKNETLAAEEFREYPEVKHVWARIETIAINTLHHIRRGKTSPKDPLWRSLRLWLISLEKDLSGLFASWLAL